MLTITPPVFQRLDDDLVLYGVRDERDAARFAGFNGTVNGADQGATSAALLNGHPTVQRDQFLIVEDTRTGAVASTTCLIPWRCRLEDVTLDVAMLEMVVTHPDYRRRGLVAAQVAQFHRTVTEAGFDLSIIEGIPYYYRQFGYAYALDHVGRDVLRASSVPVPGDAPTITLRRAAEDDIPTLMDFYATTMQPLTFYTARDAAYWRYLLTTAHYPTYLVEPATGGAPLGYISGWRHGDHVLALAESGIPAAATALAVLQHCAQSVDELWLGWPATSTLVQIGRSLGGAPAHADQWLVRIPDLARLLDKLAPVFARRLAASAWAGHTGALTLNLFRSAYRLHFADGALTSTEPLGFRDASMGADGGDLCIPQDAFVRLLLGYRELGELADAWPDIVVRPAARHLLAVLFPKFPSYLWLLYMQCGHLTPIQ